MAQHRKTEKSYNNASKKYCELHPDERKVQCKKHYESHSEKYKAYNNRICLYNNELVTLSALRRRLSRKGILNPTLEAKKNI